MVNTVITKVITCKKNVSTKLRSTLGLPSKNRCHKISLGKTQLDQSIKGDISNNWRLYHCIITVSDSLMAGSGDLMGYFRASVMLLINSTQCSANEKLLYTAQVMGYPL